MTPAQAPEACQTYHSPSAVASKLAELGIPLELLVRAAQAGFVERMNATRHDPVITGGMNAWTYPTRFLRQRLERKGWRIDDPKNLPLVISDEVKINVTVSSGDMMTGVVGGWRYPKTKNHKGIITQAAIARNNGQSDLFPATVPEHIRKFEDTLKYHTWIFLIYITDESIQAELSLPRSVDESSHIHDWAERIIINTPLPGEESLSGFDGGDQDEIFPEIVAKI